MAGIKISDLPSASSSQLTDVFPADQGAVTYKETLQQILTLFQANGSALTKTDDTNVTLTLGGSPATALLNAASLTLGWTGQLSVARGGTGAASFTAYAVICGGTTSTGALQNVSGVGTSGQVLTSNGAAALPTWQAVPAPTGAALTKTDDTNVTLTLGGTPATALLQAVSLTLGWTGQLSVSRGGTGAASLTAHYVLVGNGTSAVTLVAPSATSGIPLISQGAAADPTYGTAVVAGGGTGNTTFTAYALICAGTTATGAFQNVSGVGTLNQVLVSQGAGALPQWGSVPGLTPAALTKTDDTNVTLTLGGTPATALLQATSLTLGWTGQLSVARGGTGAAALTAHYILIGNGTSAVTLLAPNATSGIPLISQGASADPTYGTAVVAGGGTGNTTFTAYSVICAGTTATGAFQNVSGLGSANQVLTSNGAGALPTWQSVPGLTPAALTKTDDTNVTLTLGGSPSTALLQATSLTLGWTGQLGLTRGGTAASLTASNGGIVYSTASALAILGGTATAGQMLQSGASTTPAWSTSTYPATNAVNTLLYASSANVMAALATANNGVLVTSAGGVPSISSTLPQAVINNFPTPTVQVFTTGSGTYTTPANVRYIHIRMVGGGGGGSGSGTTPGAGGNGGDTTFGTLTASKGLGNAGAGGTGTNGDINIPGGAGGIGAPPAGPGAIGGGTVFGAGNNTYNTALAPATNSGVGGMGGAVTTAINQGNSGGGGGYVEKIIGSPSATYSYGVGAGGSAGTAGTGGLVGAAGAAGIIIVYEFYT